MIFFPMAKYRCDLNRTRIAKSIIFIKLSMFYDFKNNKNMLMVFLLLLYIFCTFQISNSVFVLLLQEKKHKRLFFKFPVSPAPHSHQIDNYMRIYLEFGLHFETMNVRLPKEPCLYLTFCCCCYCFLIM